MEDKPWRLEMKENDKLVFITIKELSDTISSDPYYGEQGVIKHIFSIVTFPLSDDVQQDIL
jgi:hypothetical protein